MGTGLTPALRRPQQVSALGAMVLAAGARDGVALRFPRDGQWHEWTYAELVLRARRLAHGLIALGVRPGDHVAVLSDTRPEWTLVDCAILCAGATVVPVYHTSSPEECGHVLADAQVRVAICEDAAQLAKVQAVRGGCPELDHVLVIDGPASVPSIADVAQEHAGSDDAVEQAVRAVGARDVATIVYTSGSTGPPKGCPLTHANVLATMHAYEQELQLRGDLRIFLFLPLAHVLARITELVALDLGGTLAFWSGDARRLLEDLEQARPTHVPSVPRVFEKIHTRALSTVQESSPMRQRIFERSLAVGRAFRRAQRAGRVGPLLRARHALADRLVLRRVRDLFGGSLELALSGAAPLAPEVLTFFDACGVLILEGYGMTETCAAATLNTPAAFRFGTVGRPLPGTEVAIAPDGEVLVRGPNVFSGYHGNPAATAATFADGWLATGDLGELDADGFLRITGRKKDLIITSSGKNVSPSNLEAALRESRWISQAVVYGDDHPYLVALLALDTDEVPALAAETGTAVDLAAMATDPRVIARIAADVEAVNRRFARIEQVKRFAILEHGLTHEAGDLTPTQKLKRRVVNERYRERFERLYTDA